MESFIETIDLPVNILDYEHVDLFNWYESVKNMISQNEFVRMVDIQSETIERYIVNYFLTTTFLSRLKYCIKT